MSQVFFRIVVATVASLLIIGACFGRRESQIPVVSDTEKADVVESLLQLENEAQRSDFENIRILAADNIGLLSAARIAKQGFSLMAATQIESLQRDHVVEYVRIKAINFLGDGIVVVRLSRGSGRSGVLQSHVFQGAILYLRIHKELSKWLKALGRQIGEEAASLLFEQELNH